MVVGRILERAARELKERLNGTSPAEYFAQKGALRVEKQHEPPDWLKWDDDRYRGDAYVTFAWACDVAEVEMDRDTLEVRPVRITAVQDIGRAIHPALATGQIEGGTGQGVGFALIEQVVMRNGAMANAQLTNYTIPTTLDTPEMDVHLVENPYPEGPFGAKGLGELPIDGPAPAIVNAIRSLGLDVREVPATPELLLSAIASRDSAQRHHDLQTYGAPVAAFA
jgi:CO/xanthine dehydrogenase Mo-binding subunit